MSDDQYRLQRSRMVHNEVWIGTGLEIDGRRQGFFGANASGQRAFSAMAFRTAAAACGWSRATDSGQCPGQVRETEPQQNCQDPDLFYQ